ncbi:MAG: polyhydroxybutyrate depolymerase [Pseudomonadota bacterium]
MFRILLILSLMPVRAAASEQSNLCHGQDPCFLGERSYHIAEPEGWDGTSALPVLMHFHGWKRQGTLIVRHDRIVSATSKRGVLLVAPNGANRTWDFWREGSPDVGFARAVLDDVKARYPVDEARIYISGYSWGSNIAWRFVCHDGADVAVLLGISGTLSDGETCQTAPGEVRQVYGLADTVLAFPYGPGGETDHAVKLWRDRMGCQQGQKQGEWQITDLDRFTKTAWDGCAEGRVTLDIHPGGHFIPRGWIARQLDEVMGLDPSYP